MKFVAIKTENGSINREISFYCRVLKVSRKEFYKCLRNLEKSWEYEFLAAEMKKIVKEETNVMTLMVTCECAKH